MRLRVTDIAHAAAYDVYALFIGTMTYLPSL